MAILKPIEQKKKMDEVRSLLVPFVQWMIGKDCDKEEANRIVDKYFKQTEGSVLNVIQPPEFPSPRKQIRSGKELDKALDEINNRLSKKAE